MHSAAELPIPAKHSLPGPQSPLDAHAHTGPPAVLLSTGGPPQQDDWLFAPRFARCPLRLAPAGRPNRMIGSLPPVSLAALCALHPQAASTG
eukprot:scaffold28477_cov112-Isochrysis_galbana.AAC.4